jgi:SAM-dependent methyltransferase
MTAGEGNEGERELFDAKWARLRAGDPDADHFSRSARTQYQVLYAERVTQLRRIVGRVRPGRLRTLEVGSGRGTVSQFLAADGHDVTLLDSSPQAAELARENFARHGLDGRFDVGDARELPYGSGAFDLVLSIGLLEHFDDPTPVVAEKARTCASGGVVWDEIIPAKASVQLLAAPVSAALRRYRELRTGLRDAGGHEDRFRLRMDPEEAVALYRGAGDFSRVDALGALPIPLFPVTEGSAPSRAAGAGQRAYLAARGRLLEDRWRCSFAWGQVIVVYGVRA